MVKIDVIDIYMSYKIWKTFKESILSTKANSSRIHNYMRYTKKP